MMTRPMIAALMVGAFSMIGIASNAYAEPNDSRCSNAPKDYVPCTDSTKTSQSQGD